MEKNNENYYTINVSYEIPYDAMNDSKDYISNARSILCDRLINSIPSEKYSIFNSSIVTYQLPNTYNYVVTYSSYFKSDTGLPMEEFVAARDIMVKIKKEFEEFFTMIDCDYKLLTIKPLV